MLTILKSITKMISLGIGIGITAKSGFNPITIDWSLFIPKSGFDPSTIDWSLFIPKSPKIEDILPDIPPHTSAGNQNIHPIWIFLIITVTTIGVSAAAIGAGVYGGLQFLNAIPGQILGRIGETLSRMKEKMIDLWNWFNTRNRNGEEPEREASPFEGCDPETQLTGVILGKFHMASINRMVSIYQVLSMDGSQIGIWLIDDLANLQEADLTKLSSFIRGVKCADLEKEYGEWLELLRRERENEEENSRETIIEEVREEVPMGRVRIPETRRQIFRDEEIDGFEIPERELRRVGR